MAQNATFHPFLRKRFPNGLAKKKIGHATAQIRRIPPVPTRCWRGGKTKRVQIAWEAPARPRKRAISSSEKPNPPFSTDVYQKTGATIIFVRYMNRWYGRER